MDYRILRYRKGWDTTLTRVRIIGFPQSIQRVCSNLEIHNLNKDFGSLIDYLWLSITLIKG